MSMKTTVVKSSEIFADRTMRMDAKYWIDKKNQQKSIRNINDIVSELKKLKKQKSDFVKDFKSQENPNSLTKRIHYDLIKIYDLQITTLNWVLGKRKKLA